MSKPGPIRYRTTNWKTCNAGLKKRGSLRIWPDKDMVWLAPKDGREGHPLVFTDAAIQFCLMMEVLFGLLLRQTTGLAARILEMADLDGPVPDVSTLGRRQKSMTVQIPFRRSAGPLNLLVDSTGIKIPGDGAWLARTHGTHRRRQYRKVNRRRNSPPDCFLILLILAMDAGSGDIRAVEVTPGNAGDSPMPPDLLAQIPRGETDRDGGRRWWLRHPPLPQRHPRTRGCRCRPYPQERSSLERGLSGGQGAQ